MLLDDFHSQLLARDPRYNDGEVLMLKRKRFHKLLKLTWWRQVVGDFGPIWHDLGQSAYDALRVTVKQFPHPERDPYSFPEHVLASLFDGKGGRIEYEPQMLGWYRQKGGQVEETLSFRKAHARWPEGYIISQGTAFRPLRPAARLVIREPLFLALLYLDQPVLQYRGLCIWQPDEMHLSAHEPWLSWPFRAAYPITAFISNGMAFTPSSKQVQLVLYIAQHGHEQAMFSIDAKQKRQVQLYSAGKYSYSAVAELLSEGYLQIAEDSMQTPEEAKKPVAKTLKLGIVGKLFVDQWNKDS